MGRRVVTIEKIPSLQNQKRPLKKFVCRFLIPYNRTYYRKKHGAQLSESICKHYPETDFTIWYRSGLGTQHSQPGCSRIDGRSLIEGRNLLAFCNSNSNR